MKKAFGFFLISVLLWSCGSQFSRSKYDRYMWSRSQSKIASEEKPASVTPAGELPENAFSSATNEVKPAAVANPDVMTITQQKSASAEAPVETKPANSITSTTTGLNEMTSSVAKETTRAKHKKPFRAIPDSPFQGGDANLVLLVILAIILPPLGVYLKDGGITGLFWLTLLLCLLLGGGFFLGIGILGGGGWGLAAILALLRVFDVI